VEGTGSDVDIYSGGAKFFFISKNRNPEEKSWRDGDMAAGEDRKSKKKA